MVERRHRVRQALTFLRHLLLDYYRLWIFILVPTLGLILPLTLTPCVKDNNGTIVDFDKCDFLELEPGSKIEARPVADFAYLLIIVASFWIFDILPIAVTALIPYVVLPSFGLLSSGIVAAKYMSNVNMLLIGGFMLAIAIEQSNLHRRIALGALKLVGSNPRSLMFGFMFVTWFLSMCIANTSTTALMIPIVLSVLDQLKGAAKNELEMGLENKALEEIKSEKENKIDLSIGTHGDIEETDFDAISLESVDSTIAASVDSEEEPKVEVTSLDIGLLLCIPFAASIGGTGTFTGTDLNLYLSGYYNDFYEEYTVDAYPNNGYFSITYANWAMYNLLPSFLTFILSFIWLQAFSFGWNPISWVRCEKNQGAEKVIDTEYKKLGSMKQGEYISLFCFIIVVIMWVAREPTDGSGWAYLFPVPGYMTDGMVVILVGICLFVLPIDDSGLFCIFNRFRNDKISIKHGAARPILTWDVVQRRTGWGVLILIGGGYAIAQASDDSGFSEFVATGLSQLVNGWDDWAVCLLCSVIASLFTEITSNTAACALFVPLLNKLALKICVHPLYLCLPATLACSMSFMLPAATPPNAIAFGSGRLKSINSITNGFMPKIIGVGLINVFIMIFGPLIYNTDVFPCFGLGDPTGAKCFDDAIHDECPCYPSIENLGNC